MRELSLFDISKLQESKKNIGNTLGLYKYLGGNYLIYDKFIFTDPTTNTFIQLQNLDGTLDISAESLRVKNLSILNLGTLNKLRINDELTVRGSSTVSGFLHCASNITSENSIISKNLSISNDTNLNNLIVDGDVVLNKNTQILGNLFVDTINSHYGSNTLNIGTNDTNLNINIGNVNSIVNIFGTLKYTQLENEIIQNRELVINGISGNSYELPVKNIGIFFSNGIDNKKGYFKTDSINGDHFELKSPNSDFILTFPKLNSNSSILVKENDTDTIFIDNLVSNRDTTLNNLLVINSATFTNIALNDLLIYGDLTMNGNFYNQDFKIINGNINANNLIATFSNFINSNISFANINDSKINNIHCDNLSSSIGLLEKCTIDTCNVKNLTLDNSKIKIIDNEEFSSINAKISNLNVDSLIVEKDVSIGNLLIRKDNKIYGNQNVLGSLESKKLNVLESAKIPNIYNNSINSSSVISNKINCSFLYSDEINTNKINVAKNFNIDGNLFFNRASSNSLNLLKDLTVNNNANLKNLFVNNDARFSNILVSGTIYTNEDIEVSGNLNVKNIEVSKNVKINEKLNVINDTTLNKNVYIRNDLNIGNDLNVGNNLNVDKEITLNKAIVKNNLILGNDLYISGNTHIDNDIYIQGNSNINSLCVSNNTLLNKLTVNNETELSKVYINNSLEISGTVLINNEPIINRKYIETISTTYTYLSLDGITYNYPDYIKNGIYTFIVNGQSLNKVITTKETMRNNVYSIAVDSFNNIYLAGIQNQSRIVSVYNREIEKWINLEKLQNFIVDLIKIDSRGYVYFVGDFKEDGRIYQYIPNSNTWNKLGLDINGKINTIDFDCDNNIYIGGNFTKIGDTIVNRICKYNLNTNSWEVFCLEKSENLEIGLNNVVNCLIVDSMNNLYVGGDFSKFLLKWNTSEKKWETFIDLDKSVSCFSIDSESNLYIGGRFNGSIIKYNFNYEMYEIIKNGLIGDVKNIAIDSNDNVYVGMTTAPYIYKWLEKDKKWVSCIKNINGLVLSMCFDKNDKLYIAGNFNTPFSKLIIYESDYTKTVRFNNLIKFVDNDGSLLVTKKITLRNIADTITIKFEKNVGYVIYKSGGVSLI